MIKLDVFKRRHCAKTVEQLITPRPVHMRELTLPFSSVVHHLSGDSNGLGPSAAHPLLQNTSTVWIHHAEELRQTKGRPRKRNAAVASLITRYFKQAPGHYSRSRNLERSMLFNRAVTVIDASLVHQLYVYPTSITEYFDQMDNHRQTLWLNRDLGRDESIHFITLALPDVMPTLSELRILPDPMPTARYADWADDARLGVLDLWRGLKDEKHPIWDKARRTMLAVTEGQQVAFIDLQDLTEWYKEDRTKVERYLIGFFEKLIETRSPVDTEVLEAETVEAGANPEMELPDEAVEPLPDLDLPEVEMDVEEIPDIVPNAIAPTTSKRPVNHLFDKRILVGEAKIRETVEALGDAGLLSTAEQRRIAILAERYKEIPAPNGEGTLADFINTGTVDTQLDATVANIPDKPGVVDKSMLRSSLKDFDRRYVSELMDKDIAAAVVAMQGAGVLIKDYKVERVIDPMNDYNLYSVEVIPINGKPSTITFKLPVVNTEGEFKANGVEYRMDSQRGDLPLRKTSSSRVALTSYYGKAFVDRNPKAVNNFSRWISARISKAAMDASDNSVTDIIFSTKPLPKEPYPRTFTAIASDIAEFTSNERRFIFSTGDWDERYHKDHVRLAKQKKLTLCGRMGDLAMAMDDHGVVYQLDNGKVESLGFIVDLINPAWGMGPAEFVDVRIYGKAVPLVLALGYFRGLEKLMRDLNVKHRWIPARSRLDLEPYERRIAFKDDNLVVDTRNVTGSLIVMGLNAIHRVLKDTEASALNRPGVYGELLSSLGIGRHVLRELELMRDMFIDPITRELLEAMNEPTEFEALLIRSAELLATDEYTDEIDGAQMRIRGYERFSGFIYKQLVDAIREQRNGGNPKQAKVSMRPGAVWDDIVGDPSIILVEDSNPIHNLKEKEGVTFTGQGGRSVKTMVKRTRMFHPNDLGVISESTPDSSKVAIRTYMTPNAKINSLRGTTDRYDPKVDGPASALSTTALLGPGSTHMDGKRVLM